MVKLQIANELQYRIAVLKCLRKLETHFLVSNCKTAVISAGKIKINPKEDKQQVTNACIQKYIYIFIYIIVLNSIYFLIPVFIILYFIVAVSAVLQFGAKDALYGVKKALFKLHF